MNKAQLKFKNGKFKIMLLGDIHERYNIRSNELLNKASDTTLLLTKAVQELKPDLVVYLGDNARADNEPQMRSVISRLVYPVSVRNIPMAFVYGNHDHETGVPIEVQTKLFCEYDTCCMSDSDDDFAKTGNYNLLIKDSDGERDILNLWFINSNCSPEDETVSKEDWVHAEQINWYKEKAAEIKENNGGKIVPSFVFQHIPVPEEYELLREAKPTEYLNSVKGHSSHSDRHYVLKDEVEGYLGEAPCTPDVNSGEFAAWKEVGDVKAAFFGHDHMNDFAGYVDGIMLAQSKTAGFFPYTDGCRAGVRLITIDENDVENFTTEMHYFKQFGLKSRSLGIYERNVTDRQDKKIKIAAAVAGAVAVTVGASVVYKKVNGKKKTK